MHTCHVYMQTGGGLQGGRWHKWLIVMGLFIVLVITVFIGFIGSDYLTL